jgi:hypothetical protein
MPNLCGSLSNTVFPSLSWFEKLYHHPTPHQHFVDVFGYGGKVFFRTPIILLRLKFDCFLPFDLSGLAAAKVSHYFFQAFWPMLD